MPSLRQKVTTYFRQLSFIADREERSTLDNRVPEGSLISKYLDGAWNPPDSIPKVISGKEPADLPKQNIHTYKTGPESVLSAYTGPDTGLTGVRRTRIHLSAGPDIAFIDYQEQDACNTNINVNKRSITTKKVCPAEKPSCNPLNREKDDNNDYTIMESALIVAAADPIANIENWNLPDSHAYGMAVSLYEKNIITGENIGNPVADCFGIVAREDTCIMALADGVNWGEGARRAARCAVQGAIEYLNSAIFGIHQTSSSKDIFVSLIRSFWEAHACIMEAEGALTTLTVLVVLPLCDNLGKYIACCCNVGDSLGYVYSKAHGVREITEGSHDVNSMRDMRDALGALGPVNGKGPEMNNLTLSLTNLDKGDIVFLTSDGISDNFDPVVGKFVEPLMHKIQPLVASQPNPSRLASNKHNKSTTIIMTNQKEITEPIGRIGPSTFYLPNSKSQKNTVSIHSTIDGASRTRYTRSKTSIEPRERKINQARKMSTLPLVTGTQRHQLTMLRMADILMYGMNATPRPCTTAKQLCQLLINFVTCITSAKRNLLEQRELYYKIIIGKDGHKKEIEYTKYQQKITRKRIMEGSIFSSLPGKLDHATVVAYTVGVKHSYSEK